MVPKITMTHTPDASVKEFLLDQIREYAWRRIGNSSNHRLLAILLSDPETEEILGGVWSETYCSFLLHINLLFIPESMRGAGLGRQLIAQAKEEAAVRCSCHGVWLDALSWQARGFYEKLGYSLFANIDDYPMGHQGFFLKKAI